jgi:hypothetical protein
LTHHPTFREPDDEPEGPDMPETRETKSAEALVNDAVFSFTRIVWKGIGCGGRSQQGAPSRYRFGRWPTLDRARTNRLRGAASVELGGKSEQA